MKPMTGEELLQKLLALTPEARQLPVVAKDHDYWFYDMTNLELTHVDAGRENYNKEANCIALS